MKSKTRILGWALASSLFLFVNVAAGADEVPRQSQNDLTKYPEQGLSPLYDMTAAECKRILSDDASWHVLPFPISNVVVSPDQSPCFEMCRSGWDPNDMLGKNEALCWVMNQSWGGSLRLLDDILCNNAEAIRRAAERSWGGAFHLLYNSNLQARHGEDVWIGGTGAKGTLMHLSKDRWTCYHAMGLRQLACDARGDWWIACGQGLFRLKEGTWERAKIPNWPNVPVLGVVSDPQGRLIAWANRIDKPGNLLAVRINDTWKSREFEDSGEVNNIVLRGDGSVILFKHWQIVVTRPTWTSDAPRPSCHTRRKRNCVIRKKSSITIVDDCWGNPESAPAISANACVLVAVRKTSTEETGLVRLPSQGPPQWIPFQWSHGIQIEVGRNEEFLIFSPKEGLFGLAERSYKPRKLASADNFQPDDRLRGCDKEGRVYFQRYKDNSQRDKGFLVFSPAGKPTPMVACHPIGELGDNGTDESYRLGLPTEWQRLKKFGRPEFEFPQGVVWGYRSEKTFRGYEVAGEQFRRSCVPLYVEDLTPLYGEGDKVVCQTPDGLALLRFLPDKASEDAVIQRIRVAWCGRPVAYIGRSNRRLFFVTRGYDRNPRLVMIELPESEEWNTR